MYTLVLFITLGWDTQVFVRQSYPTEAACQKAGYQALQHDNVETFWCCKKGLFPRHCKGPP